VGLVRKRLLAPEFSVRRYAERVYDAVSALAEPAAPWRDDHRDRLCA
jgi:hypothetical protein